MTHIGEFAGSDIETSDSFKALLRTLGVNPADLYASASDQEVAYTDETGDRVMGVRASTASAAAVLAAALALSVGVGAVAEDLAEEHARVKNPDAPTSPVAPQAVQPGVGRAAVPPQQAETPQQPSGPSSIPSTTPKQTPKPSPTTSPSAQPAPSGKAAEPNVCPTPETQIWNPEILDGHKLPALRGGVGFEQAINESGHVIDANGHVNGGKVSFAGYADRGQAYRDYYITMRWDMVRWAWNGKSTHPTAADLAWYAQRGEPLKVLVVNPRTGQSIVAVVLESGPAPWAGTPGGRDDNKQKRNWETASVDEGLADGFVDGTPAGYNGRVAGLPPVAQRALGLRQWMYGGPANGGSGDDVLIAWAPDQTGAPGLPTNLNAAAAAMLLGHRSGPIELPNTIDTVAMCNKILNTNVSLDQVDKSAVPEIGYEYATGPSTGPQPGAVQLRDFIRAVWHTSPDDSVFGIYNPDADIDGSGWSLHAEGRAIDFGLNANNKDEKARGDQLVAWAIKNARELGIQEVIWNKRIWTSDHGWREYEGSNPHTNHIHVGLTWAGAKTQLPLYHTGILKTGPAVIAGRK